MTPPLPPGHYAGDGHNHGAAIGDNHNHDHGHVHGGNESPEDHLHHMQDRQSARGQATLEEFHQAAQDTAMLRAGRQPESARQPETNRSASSGREQAQPRSDGRESAAARQSSSGFASSETHAGNARFFSPQGFASTSSWLRAIPNFAQFLPQQAARQSTTPQAPVKDGSVPLRETPAQVREAFTAVGTVATPSGSECPGHEAGGLQVLQEFHQALQQALQSGKPGEAAKALSSNLGQAMSALMEEALHNPELLRQMPPALQTLVAQMAGISPKALQAWLGLAAPQISLKGVEGSMGMQILFRLASLGAAGPRPSAEAPFQGLLGMLNPFGAVLPSLPRYPVGLLQRLEKALMQFLQLFSAKTALRSGAKEEVSGDELLLQQIAALVASKEKRFKEKDRVKKKGSAHEVVQTKRDSDFSEEEEEDAELFESFKGEESVASFV